MIRRKFLLTILVAAFCVYFFNPFKPKAFRTKKRLIILGFDGADPGLLDRYMSESPEDFPNLAKLANIGIRKKLKTSFPPESPVAWSCFAVGGGPGNHGVFDFLRRPAGSYFPSMESFVKKGHARFIFNLIPIKMPKAIRRRGGTAFWDVLSRYGVKTSMIEVPVTFPPPKLTHGRALSGLGVPDIRGIQATFHHFVYDETADTPLSEETTFGGKIEELKQDNDWYKGHIWGPYDPIADQHKREKEVELLDKVLENYEWLAHLYSIRGEKHVTPEERAKLADRINIDICGRIAYQDYLESDEFEHRIQTLKNFLVGSQKTFEKEPDSKANRARERMAEIQIKIEELKAEIQDSVRPIKAEVAFRPEGSEAIEIRIGGERQIVKINTWSDWFTVHFPVLPLIKARAVCKFYPQEITDTTIKVYMTSPDMDPRKPATPISHPKSYSKELADWLGQPYKTRGWAAETHGLKDGRLGEEAFLEDLFFVMKQREQKLFETLERTDNNVLISVFSETDRVAHMFYRFLDKDYPMYDEELAQKYGDAIKRVYKRMDEIVGRMLNKISADPDATLMVMSDHGFSPFNYQVDLNLWLVENGFMKLKGSSLQKTDMKLAELLKGGSAEYFEYVDWSGTKAYSMGLGQIYINKKGREPLGVVEDQDYDSVCTDIVEKLSVLKDEREGRNNASVIAHVKKRREIWNGPYGDDAHDCPDLQVCFHSSYRVAWQTCLGGISTGQIVDDNLERWSGDHCSMNPDEVPGMFFCNKKIKSPDVSLYDFCPTVLRYFGLKVPKGVEGKDLQVL